MTASQMMLLGGAPLPAFRWNSADKAAIVTLSGSDLVANIGGGGGTDGNVRATISKNSGKWYFEATLTTAGNRSSLGVANSSFVLTSGSSTADVWWYWAANGAAEHSGAVDQSGGTVPVDGNVLALAVDFTNSQICYAINNTWQFGADPAAGTGGQSFGGGTVFPMCGTRPSTNPVWTLPVGSLTYTPPSGFSRWQ